MNMGKLEGKVALSWVVIEGLGRQLLIVYRGAPNISRGKES